jgi:hypothetical protein
MVCNGKRVRGSDGISTEVLAMCPVLGRVLKKHGIKKANYVIAIRFLISDRLEA